MRGSAEVRARTIALQDFIDTLRDVRGQCPLYRVGPEKTVRERFATVPSDEALRVMAMSEGRFVR